MFGVVVPKVVISRFEVDEKLTLGSTIDNPMVSHVDSLGAFDLDLFVGEAKCCRVVDLDGSRRLDMPEFFEGDHYRDSLRSIYVGACYFCFGSGANDIFQNFANGVNWSIEGGAYHGWFRGIGGGVA